MATSGTATFNPEIVEIVEEAYERCGLELRSGYDLKTARRSLDGKHCAKVLLGTDLFLSNRN